MDSVAAPSFTEDMQVDALALAARSVGGHAHVSARVSHLCPGDVQGPILQHRIPAREQTVLPTIHRQGNGLPWQCTGRDDSGDTISGLNAACANWGTVFSLISLFPSTSISQRNY